MDPGGERNSRLRSRGPPPARLRRQRAPEPFKRNVPAGARSPGDAPGQGTARGPCPWL